MHRRHVIVKSTQKAQDKYNVTVNMSQCFVGSVNISAKQSPNYKSQSKTPLTTPIWHRGKFCTQTTSKERRLLENVQIKKSKKTTAHPIYLN